MTWTMCKKLFLDVDGVMADFVGGMMVAHNKPWPYSSVFGDKAWDLAGIWGINHHDFWAPCGYSFWKELEKMPEADAILATCIRRVGRERVCFLTSPAMQSGSMEGRRDWLAEHYPDVPVLFSVGSGSTPPKQFCAGHESILIDDYSPTVDKFVAWGGAAFLVGRPWNRSYGRERAIVEDLDDFLDEAVFD